MQVGTCPRARASHRGMYFTSKPPLLPLLHCSYTTFFNHSARCPTVCDRYDRDFLQLYAEQSDNTTPAIYPCFELPFSCLPFKLLLLSILKVVIWDWETVWVPRQKVNDKQRPGDTICDAPVISVIPLPWYAAPSLQRNGHWQKVIQ